MKFKIRRKVNKHQAEVLKDNESRMLHLSTGFGGGKTFALCYKLLLLSYLNKDLHGGLVVPDFPEFKKDVLPELEQILDRHKIRYKYHGTEHWFQFPWSKGRIYVVSAVKKIRGPNWAFAVINEVTLISLTRYKEVIGRVRVKRAKHPQIFSCGTPEGFLSEYYEYFIEKPPKNFRIVYGKTDDNLKNLDGDYLEILEDTYDKSMMDAYRSGLWVPMSNNRFYYAYTSKNESKLFLPQMFELFHCSMDFNVDPFCATLWGYDGFKIFGVDEVKLEGGKGFSTQNMIEALKARGYTPANTIIYPDPAGKQRKTAGKPDVDQLRRAGYEVKVKAAAPRFRQRQLAVNNLLDKGRIMINPERCPGIRKDFLGVEYDVVLQEKKKDNPKLTHFSDGVDYMVDIMFPWSGNPKPVTAAKVR